jgi:hypothetical protein
MRRLERVASSAILAGDHAYLTPADECYFMGTYRCRAGEDLWKVVLAFKNSEINAIDSVAAQLGRLVPREWLSDNAFVPIPSSSGFVSDATRLALQRAGVVDLRPALVRQVSSVPSHLSVRTPPQWLAYSFDEAYGSAPPKAVVLFDDVLTSGAHFRAAKWAIRDRWNVHVIGLFICRTCSLWRRCRLSAQDVLPQTGSCYNLRCHLCDGISVLG